MYSFLNMPEQKQAPHATHKKGSRWQQDYTGFGIFSDIPNLKRRHPIAGATAKKIFFLKKNLCALVYFLIYRIYTEKSAPFVPWSTSICPMTFFLRSGRSRSLHFDFGFSFFSFHGKMIAMRRPCIQRLDMTSFGNV